MWDAQSGENMVASNQTEGPLAWSFDGTYLACPQPTSQIDFWGVPTNQLIASYRTRGMFNIKALSLSPNGKWFAASGLSLDPYGHEIAQVWEILL